MKLLRTCVTIVTMVAVLGWGVTAEADLVGYWDFDEDSGNTFYDTAGGPGANAPYDGNVVRNDVLGAAGKFGNAFRHYGADGSSTGVVPSTMISDNSLDGANARTFSLWMNHNHSYTGNDPGIQLISYGAGGGGWGGGEMLMLCLQGSGNQRRIVPMVHERGWWGDSSTVGALNEWNHLVLAYDAGANFSAMRLYVNGQELAFVDSEADPVLNTVVDDFGIGGPADGGWNNYNGRIDDLGAWNEALSAGKSIAMYNILSPNGGELDDYTVDKMNALFQVYDTGTPDTVTSDAGDLTWYPFTGSGSAGDVTYDGTGYYAFFDDNLGVSTTPEPATLALVGLGGVATLIGRKRRRQ